MPAIFENKKIEIDDLKSLKFPHGAILTNLPPNCRNLSKGQSSKLDVKDDQGSTHKLTVKNSSGKIYFTDGWEKFMKEKDIKEKDFEEYKYEISLYKEVGYFGTGDQWKIEVKKAKKKRDR